MTRSNQSHQDRDDQLDKTLDAMMRGDHSNLDALPPELAATVARLFWLAQESAGIDEPEMRLQSDDRPVAGIGPVRQVTTGRPVMIHDPARAPSVAPISARTRKAAGVTAEEAAPAEDTTIRHPRRFRGINTLVRIAAIVLVLVIAGGSIYGIITLRDQDDTGGTGDYGANLSDLQELHPSTCVAAPRDRDYALSVLRDVDVERDEALRRATLLRHANMSDIEVTRFKEIFVTWQSCRRFGFTYEAMALQAPYFTREDFYGETSLDFRGPVETAYTDATLNEMLDRREELDATSRVYWENAGYYPSPPETLILGGERFTTDDGEFVAIRALSWNMNGEWVPTTTVVVFQLIDGEYLIFDIQSTPNGTPPYL